MRRARFAEILRLLAENEVEFVVVEMTAGILQGAPTTTLDLDLVHRRTPGNVERLLRVLRELDATYRHDPRGLRPAESHLAGPGHSLLTTRLGDLDCLGTIDQDRGYEDLLPHTLEIEVGARRRIRVLTLPALIEARERAGRPKDLASLPLLRATVDELARRS